MAEGRWLLVGLGNPGNQYAETRHNVGFQAIVRLAEVAGFTGKAEPRFKARVANGRWHGIPLILAQPMTYMNLSGEAVALLMRYYDIPPERLLVIYDDAALPFGRLRVRAAGSAGGQNGIKSIIEHLGNVESFPRLRIGIGSPAFDLSSHVLSKFTPDEQQQLPVILTQAVEAVRVICQDGIEAAQNQFNGWAPTVDTERG